MKYNISEIFHSIQGEGAFTGAAMIFIRFAGCNLRCDFCDTKESWNNGKEMSIDDILIEIGKYTCFSVCITGGEPTEQNLLPLLRKLNQDGYIIHLETNGTNSLKNIRNYFWHISVSPKIQSVPIHPEFYKFPQANEIKIIIDREYKSTKDITDAYSLTNEILFSNDPITDLYLQPEGNKAENIQTCIQLIKNDPNWKLSLQLHKIIGIK